MTTMVSDCGICCAFVGNLLNLKVCPTSNVTTGMCKLGRNTQGYQIQ